MPKAPVRPTATFPSHDIGNGGKTMRQNINIVSPTFELVFQVVKGDCTGHAIYDLRLYWTAIEVTTGREEGGREKQHQQERQEEEG